MALVCGDEEDETEDEEAAREGDEEVRDLGGEGMTGDRD